MAEEQNLTEKSDAFKSVYDDTSYFIDNIVKEYGFFQNILTMMRDGEATIELKKRYILRAIDETWVNAIEDTLPALDELIRNPSKYIEEREELMPIELSRNISVRSMQHLAQHTNYINSFDAGKVTPSKLLNVFREETLLTYENKFINTLIDRLFIFVNRRYEIAKREGQDEKTTNITFKEDFEHGEIKVKMNFNIEIAEDITGTDDKASRNFTYTTDLWRRVEKLNSIVTTYKSSEFCANIGNNFIRPPVMATNAIMKNKNLNQCLTLWQFLEGYDNAGYSMLVQEDLENVDEDYIKELYSTLALQYLIFRYNIKNEFQIDNTLASAITDDELRPHIVGELGKLSENEFNIKDEKPEVSAAKKAHRVLTADDKFILDSLSVSLEAAEILQSTGEEDYFLPARIAEPEPEALKEEEPEEEEEFDEYGEEGEEEEPEDEGMFPELRESLGTVMDMLKDGYEEGLQDLSDKLTEALEKVKEMLPKPEEKPEPQRSARQKSGKRRRKGRRSFDKNKNKNKKQ